MSNVDFEEISSKFECVKLGMRHTKDGHILALAIHPNDTPEEVFKDPLGTRYMIVAVRLNDQNEPVASPDQEEGRQAVKIAGTLCSDSRFQGWLVFSNLVDDIGEEAAAAYVRQFCGVKSRAELKVSKRARERLYTLRDEFMQYMRSR